MVAALDVVRMGTMSINQVRPLPPRPAQPSRPSDSRRAGSPSQT